MSKSPYELRRAEIARNLLAARLRATDDDVTRGLAWYPTACYGVEQWADRLGYSRASVACVIASISPQCEWNANLKIALAVLTGATVSQSGGATTRNIKIAHRIAETRAESLDTFYIVGSKVKAFALNLQGYGDAVTVDTHMGQAAENCVLANPRLGSPIVYNIIAECTRAVARGLGERPCDTQAIVWYVWKREHPRTSKLIARRQWHVVGEL